MDRVEKVKKVYEKPSYEVEEIFEKMSLLCDTTIMVCKISEVCQCTLGNLET
jgi:hypothetical protein